MFHVKRDRGGLYRVMDPRTNRVLTNAQGATLDDGGCRRKSEARRLADAATAYLRDTARRRNEDRAAVAAGRRVGRTALRVANVDQALGRVSLEVASVMVGDLPDIPELRLLSPGDLESYAVGQTVELVLCRCGCNMPATVGNYAAECSPVEPFCDDCPDVSACEFSCRRSAS